MKVEESTVLEKTKEQKMAEQLAIRNSPENKAKLAELALLLKKKPQISTDEQIAITAK